MSDKMSLKTYECRACKKLTSGYPALYRHKCLKCRNFEMRSMIERERLSKLTQKELILENKKLQQKLRNIKDADIYEDDISADEDFDNDPTFITKSPQIMRKKSILESASSCDNAQSSDNVEEDIDIDIGKSKNAPEASDIESDKSNKKNGHD